MMKKLFGFILISSLLTVGCFNFYNFPEAPAIEYKDIAFKNFNNAADSLIITIGFQDGDGDLGLSSDEIYSPFHDKNYFIFDELTKEIATIPSDTTSFDYIRYKNKRITYHHKRIYQELDTLPPYTHPYTCTNWYVPLNNQGAPIDTFYYQLNKNYYNILVDYYVEKTTGVFEKFDWRTDISNVQCGDTHDGRFPRMLSDGTVKAIEGSIIYSMGSVGFEPLFSIKRLKLKIQIFDRKLHESNIIETPPFTLSEITVK